MLKENDIVAFRFVLATILLSLLTFSAGAGTLANPNATQTALNLYNHLASLSGKSSKRVISGQEVGNANPSYNVYSSAQGYQLYVTNLKTATGILVGMAGFDYSADPTPSYNFPQITQAGVLQAVNTNALNHWKQGGIVTIMFGANNPWTGGAGTDTNTNGHRLIDAITPNTAAYAKWIEQLDSVAVALSQLQDAGVAVLWRPLHEMNGSWFWWGSPANPQDYKDLWQHMFNYFTNTKKLNNLIWVYSASSGANNAQNTVNIYYPGSNYVDIVGVDGYKNSIDSAIIACYNNLLLNGKPFALTEYGPASTSGTLDYSTLITGIRSSLPQTSYFMAWADCPTCNPKVYWSMVGNKNAGTLLNDSWVANASDLPNFVSNGQVALTLSSGWNLLGNSANTALDVASSWLADVSKITSVWKWNAARQKWAFYAPGQSDGGAAFAATRGYDVLATINAGEGFWVQATQAFTAQLPAGTAVTSASMSSLPSGWNLISVGDNPTPASFNLAMGATAPVAGTTPTNVITLWAWGSSTEKWYFYAPSLQSIGGTSLIDYITQNGYLDFATSGKTLQPGTGFWVKRP